jgi:HPt (histidine-containing phosphotransfer) domain-containing protein
VHVSDETIVLDREQLREITLDDEELMREILTSLVDDTAKQLVLLDHAIRQQDAQQTMRLAHYSKGACANVGANAMAALLKRLEQQAAGGRLSECAASFQTLQHEAERLRLAAALP